MSRVLRAGFVRLTDASPLLVARELGFAAREGIRLEVAPEPSWANLRDKLAAGLLDAAPLLAPAAIAGAAGARFLVPAALSFDGNAVTVSRALANPLRAEGATPADTARRLGALASARKGAGGRPPAFGVVFPQSSHDLMLRLWLETGGVDAGEIDVVVVPPPLMAQALAEGQIEGFCAGAPWGEVAEASGAGLVLHQGPEIAPGLPEKVLAVTDALLERRGEDVAALVRALVSAGSWCADGANAAALAERLAEPRHLGQPAALLARDLPRPGEGRARGPRFGGAEVMRPRLEDEAWLRRLMAARRPPAPADPTPTYRPDLFDAALAGGGASA